ncbi:hypothetical protein EC957_001588 [Mortierella hygrophila]|uniref:Uncharacterized protein n=1 Tax=Mortierella hygrophila TaxID=979708 RepID=A0A9P6FFJ0_9FUNG|nr:hypothetical protein EC957_001588 [Mortierella hygrophila]
MPQLLLVFADNRRDKKVYQTSTTADSMVDDDVSESLPVLEESQAAMEESWRTLTAACIDKMQGRSVDDLELPDVETQGVEDVLLEQVLSLLSKPAVSAVDYSAMFTALTGVVDLRRH